MAKWAAGPYHTDGAKTSWVKIKNPTYTQAEGATSSSTTVRSPHPDGSPLLPNGSSGGRGLVGRVTYDRFPLTAARIFAPKRQEILQGSKICESTAWSCPGCLERRYSPTVIGSTRNGHRTFAKSSIRMALRFN